MKGLYIHIPFCIKKCDYCDFISYAGKECFFESYIDALTEELKEYKGCEIDTIFFGGGTPSILNPSLITKLCNSIKNNFNISENCEWTTEANPGTLTPEKLTAMLLGGINRISIGVQSFNDNELKAAGRIHSAKTAYETVLLAKNAGFDNISIDLMESLPYQTRKSFEESLKTAVSLPLTHISVYSLIIEENTPLKQKYDSGIYSMPDEDNDRAMYHYTSEFLSRYGFNRYEISNYAKPGFESKHNLKYWNCEEYIGSGLAAHSYLDSKRFSNVINLDEYIGGKFHKRNIDTLTDDDKIKEFMMLGLRKTNGISLNEFYNRFGKTLEDVYHIQLKKFIKLDLIKLSSTNCHLTEKGLDVANAVMCEFM